MMNNERDEFVNEMSIYLSMISKDVPHDAPTNGSHHKLNRLYQKWGKDFVNEQLDTFFKANPNW
jgi:hypothetical protein